jgi:hypothetical protein
MPPSVVLLTMADVQRLLLPSPPLLLVARR